MRTHAAFQLEGNVSGAGKQSAGETSFRFLIHTLSTDDSLMLIPLSAASSPSPISDVLPVGENATCAFCVWDTTGRQPFIFASSARYSVAFRPSNVALFAAAALTSAVYVAFRLSR